MNTFSTAYRYCAGIQPDRPESRALFQAERIMSFADPVDPACIIQPASFVRDQLTNPSCGGNSLAAAIDARVGGPERVLAPISSGVGIWKGALVRQSGILDIAKGIALEFAIADALFHGWRAYESGEDGIEHYAETSQVDELSQQLDAYDHRALGAEHFVPPIGDLDALDAAIAHESTAIIIGGGTRDPYFATRGDPGLPDRVLGTDALGGDSGGHARRIRGVRRVSGRRQYLEQGSYGVFFGGCHLPDGAWACGCYWVDEDVVRGAWDIHGLVIKI